MILLQKIGKLFKVCRALNSPVVHVFLDHPAFKSPDKTDKTIFDEYPFVIGTAQWENLQLLHKAIFEEEV